MRARGMLDVKDLIARWLVVEDGYRRHEITQDRLSSLGVYWQDHGDKNGRCKDRMVLQIPILDSSEVCI